MFVVRTLEVTSTLLTNLCVQYRMVNYNYSVAEQADCQNVFILRKWNFIPEKVMYEFYLKMSFFPVVKNPLGLAPWVWKIPWRRKWQPIPVFLPGKSHGQRSLVGFSPQGRKRVRHALTTKQQ